MAQNNKTNKPVVLSPAEKSFMGMQIRAAKKKAHERRPNNIAKRWSRNVQRYMPGTENKEAYVTTPLYVIRRRTRKIGGSEKTEEKEGALAGAQRARPRPPPLALYYEYMEAVDTAGDTVMCCCECDGDGDGDGGGLDRCRLRGFLGEKGQVWTRGVGVEVEFTHGDFTFLQQVMRDSYVSADNIEIYYE